MDKEQGNKLIAIYDGYKEIDGKFWRNKAWITLPGLKYNSDWNRLMPVVQKISKHYDEESDDYFEQLITLELDPYYLLELKVHAPITSVWIAVIKFIEWYNTQSPVNNPAPKAGRTVYVPTGFYEKPDKDGYYVAITDTDAEDMIYFSHKKGWDQPPSPYKFIHWLKKTTCQFFEKKNIQAKAKSFANIKWGDRMSDKWMQSYNDFLCGVMYVIDSTPDLYVEDNDKKIKV